MKKLIILMLLCLSFSANAATAWYGGKITRIWSYGGGNFVLMLDSGALDDCKHRYAYFKDSVIGPEAVKSTYSMALAAFLAGQSVRMVIDKQGVDQYCEALSLDMRK